VAVTQEVIKMNGTGIMILIMISQIKIYGKCMSYVEIVLNRHTVINTEEA